MKTPIQELIEQIKEERDGFLKLPPHSNIQERTENCFGSCIEIAERMLEKEKEQMCEFAWEYERECRINLNRSIEDCWDKFNTKER